MPRVLISYKAELNLIVGSQITLLYKTVSKSYCYFCNNIFMLINSCDYTLLEMFIVWRVLMNVLRRAVYIDDSFEVFIWV